MQGLLFCGDVVAMNGGISIDRALQEKLRSNISFCNLEAPILPKTGGGGNQNAKSRTIAIYTR